MKKVFLTIIMLISMTVLFFAFGTTASAETYGDLTYTISGGSVTITDCDNSAMIVEIPAKIKEYPVTTIGNKAFYYCENLISITIPDSVTSIGSWAFCNCENLTSITIPASVKSIGDSAFSGCSLLKKVYATSLENWIDIDFADYPSNPMSNGSELHFNNELVTDVIIPDNVTFINDYLFSGCTSLSNITIPDSVTSIGNDAFAGCTNISSIIIPDSVSFIGNEAFAGCTNLTSINIPDSVMSIGYEAFYNCNSLKKVYATTVENWVKIKFTNSYSSPMYNGGELYFNNELVTDLIIPDGVTSISSAFSGCTSLKNVVIPDSVIDISSTFSGCKNLTNVTIPDSVINISYAFSECTNLTNVIIPDSVVLISGAFADCTSLTSIVIPKSVVAIDSYAFLRCTKLTNIVIPDSVIKIGDGAFDSCNLLKNVFYTGTEKQWNDITISSRNTSIETANIHFEHKHTLGEWIEIIPAEKYKDGLESRTCSVCKYEERRAIHCGHEHDYDYVVTTPATCTKTGIGTYTCECADMYTEIISSTGHTEEIIPGKFATCTETGLTDGSKCSVCETVIKAQEGIPAIGHTFGEWSVVKVPTGTEEGSEERICSVCKEKETRAIEKLNYVIGDANGDGEITASDARIALRISAGIDTLESVNAVFEAVDFNADKEITASDARGILRKAAGLE